MESQPKNHEFRKNPEKLSPMHLSYDSKDSICQFSESKQQAFIHLWKFRANSNKQIKKLLESAEFMILRLTFYGIILKNFHPCICLMIQLDYPSVQKE